MCWIEDAEFEFRQSTYIRRRTRWFAGGGGEGGWSIPYDNLTAGKAPPQKSDFVRFEVYKFVGISDKLTYRRSLWLYH